MFAGWPPPKRQPPRLELWIALGILVLALEDLVLVAEHLGVVRLPR